MDNTIIQGDALSVLKGMQAESINCCISSPPYWALRDYGWDTCTIFGTLDDFVMPKSQKKRDRWWTMIRVRAHRRGGIFSPNKKTWIGALGLEPTFELYIDHLCAIYDEVRRVLRKDGTCWVNLGDTYNSGGNYRCQKDGQEEGMISHEHYKNTGFVKTNPKEQGLPTKSLCCIPDRFRIEMINRGWILRNKIEWHKPNPMPSSAKDRFTVDFEDVMFFVKSNETLSWIRPDGVMASKQPDHKSGVQGLDWEWGVRKGKRVKLSLWKGYCYFFEPIYEPHLGTGHIDYSKRYVHNNPKERNNGEGCGYKELYVNPLGRNKRTVWTIPTQAYSDAHFATFPEKLVEPMILSGCPREVCSKCGQGRRKVYDLEYPKTRAVNSIAAKIANKSPQGKFADKRWDEPITKHFKGYTDCGCGEKFTNGIVLDPFVGRARLARSLPRTDETGLELNSNRNISIWPNAA